MANLLLGVKYKPRRRSAERLVFGIELLLSTARNLGREIWQGTEPSCEAPVPEWWPFRNQLLITMAAAVALSEGVKRLVIGSVANDRSHADGRKAFFDAMNRVLVIQEGALNLVAPAIEQTTVDLCRDVPFEILAWTHSCHVSDYACGRCRGCVKHRETMHALGHGEY